MVYSDVSASPSLLCEFLELVEQMEMQGQFILRADVLLLFSPLGVFYGTLDKYRHKYPWFNKKCNIHYTINWRLMYIVISVPQPQESSRSLLAVLRIKSLQYIKRIKYIYCIIEYMFVYNPVVALDFFIVRHY